MSSEKKIAPASYVIDVHTHLYLPRYIEMLRERKVLPRVEVKGDVQSLIILPDDEPMGGRPIQEDYWNIDRKREWMKLMDIDHSILSLANPWLDFMEDGEDTTTWATELNKDMENICQNNEKHFSGFGVLPLNSASAAVAEIERISKLPHLKGIILGTKGLGKGLDDPALDEVWQKLEEKQLVVFVHPHYGIDEGNKLFDGYGHSLHLALGFPFETTTAIARLVLSGVLERFPKLKILLAHSGGTLPFLAGRIDSCVKEDLIMKKNLSKPPSEYLKMLYYDALSYHTPSVTCTSQFVGVKSMMFGTDHPFAISDPAKNYSALMGFDKDFKESVLNKNASELLGLLIP